MHVGPAPTPGGFGPADSALRRASTLPHGRLPDTHTSRTPSCNHASLRAFSARCVSAILCAPASATEPGGFGIGNRLFVIGLLPIDRELIPA